MTKKTIIVEISDAKVTNNTDDLLVTYSLGSCIGVCFFDPTMNIGGMLHCQLPDSKLDSQRAMQRPYMFVDTGIKSILEQMENLGAKKNKLQAKIAGAAEMGIGLTGFDIGKRNFLAIRKQLWQNSIMITAKEVGGSEPRNMYFDIGSGAVTIKSKEVVKVL